MKKKLTAVVLSLVLALSSTGIVQVRAADTTGQEAAPVQEETEAGQAESIAGNASEGEAEQTETADVQDDIAQPDENGDISGRTRPKKSPGPKKRLIRSWLIPRKIRRKRKTL